MKLQFEFNEIDCFEVRLAKFLAENATVLGKLQIDDGEQYLSDHVDRKVARWRRGNAQKNKNLVEQKKGFIINNSLLEWHCCCCLAGSRTILCVKSAVNNSSKMNRGTINFL